MHLERQNNMLLDRFLSYVKIDTQSDENSNETPSSKKQLDLLRLLHKELSDMSVKAEIDKYGRLYASIEGNKNMEPIGLCAHVDTASETSGKNVKPQVIKDYDGSDIKLGKSGLTLSKKEYPHLSECIHKTIITTDGTTLLGGDDKAGVAIIMEVVAKYLELPKDERHPMHILFTPDEEIGRGAEHLDLKKFKAKFAYTFDGSEPNVINIENFNAKSAKIDITGKSIHPGDAKGVMVNAALVAAEFASLLPKKLTPAETCLREGFNHLTHMEGEVEHATLSYILRNHDGKKLEKQEATFWNITKKLQKKYQTAKIELTVTDSYKNMLGVIIDKPESKNHIERVFRKLNISYKYLPIRGGTDGSVFSYMGCPCPNLGTGSYNHHGRYEFAVLEEMQQLVNIGLEIFKI